MSSITKKEINKDATMHMLSMHDRTRLHDAYFNLNQIINRIIELDELPEGIWLPSEDFKYLIRQMPTKE